MHAFFSSLRLDATKTVETAASTCLNNIIAVALFCLAGTTSAYTPKYNVNGVDIIIRNCRNNYKKFNIIIPSDKSSRVYDCIGYLAHGIYCVANSPALYYGILNYCQTENCRSGYVGHEKKKRKNVDIPLIVGSNPISYDFYKVLENCDGER
ncbi:hypothetical protein PIROE2DRAFT_4421 [Piromyces sp. E2]|nr:hypothetical protein PIROE2DRAFT_4421 [Piromyces sp. E2]|eukprot:OUM68001.1 hypothetical protein PIROE2DRAFT_4421 [Piromyces sp. E2]